MILALKADVLWKAHPEHQFNAIAYGKLFQRNKDSIVTIGEDGIVRIYDLPSTSKKDLIIKPIGSLETKCGPASHILLNDVTRLSPSDMIVADTRGSVVLFCDGQILVRRCSLSGKGSRVTALEVQETGLGHVCVIVGYDNGELSCFNTFTHLWKLRLEDLSNQNMRKSVSVTCILATAIVTSSMGAAEDYILVADSVGYLHVLEQGKVITSIHVKSVVTSMVPGYFLQLEDSSKNTKMLTQVALGCSDGSIWICIDFNLEKTSLYADVGHPITHLRKVPTKHNFVQSVVGNADDSNVDILICGGHFSALKILQHGKVIHSHPLTSWPTTMCGLRDSLTDENRGAVPDPDDSMILIGCQDSSLQLVAIT